MRALTVQQPWAWAIFHGKGIENRTWAPRHRGPLAIHAGTRWSQRGADSPLVHPLCRWPINRDAFTRGAIIGMVDLVDVHPEQGRCCTPWGESSYVEHGGRERGAIFHLVLERARLLSEPVPHRGLLGCWPVPADVETLILAGLAA